MPNLTVQLTVVLLTLAAVVFLIQAIQQSRLRQLAASSFSTLLLVVLVGWLVTEDALEALGHTLGMMGRLAHIAVMVLVAATLTVQLKRSLSK
ncbi:MAG TPA: hypothetical protein VJZ75_01420 [Candidatus Bathyarchaeia archaeon]|nr:hypothetical protein [Candidatus Bathyarchaeia archaeon]